MHTGVHGTEREEKEKGLGAWFPRESCGFDR